MEDVIYQAEEGGELEIVFELDEDTNSNNELSSGRSTIDEDYRILEQQLLQAGKLGDIEISARIKKATFGVFNGQPACLIHVQVDFSPRNGKSFFRFRSATVDIDFEEVDSTGTIQPVADEARKQGSSEEGYTKLFVPEYYPKQIRGHIQHSSHTRGAKLKADPGGYGVGVEIGRSKKFSKESRHLVKGRYPLSGQSGVKWTVDENEATKSGIYLQPEFAAIVQYNRARGFAMRVWMTATTYGLLRIRGKKNMRTIFQNADESSDQDLGKVDLEELTKMESVLLAERAPGAGQAIQADQGSDDAV